MSPKPRVLILNPTCLDALDAQPEALPRGDVEWVADAAFRNLESEEADALLRGAHGLILPAAVPHLPLAEAMERHRTLRVLSIAASGYDWLDVEAATRSGIVVTHAPVEEGSEVVADLAWGLILAVARQIPHHHHQVCAGRYERGMGVAVWRKTLGIVGLGRIGRAVARRARGFEMPVVAADPAPDRAFARAHEIELLSLDELLERSDFVSLHVRLDGATRGLIGERELARMKPSAFVINAARAQLIDEEALTRAILEHRIAGAGLDDPPARAGSPLRRLPNVVFTPHLGNRAWEGVHAVFRCAAENAVAALEGRRPRYVVNPEVYDTPSILRRSREAPAHP